MMVQQVRPHHGETLLDGAAQSVRYGGMLRDRSGQLDNVNSEEVADSANFIMGSDASEFVNQVKDQVRKRQKRMSNVADSGEKHSIIWGMLLAATMNAATFMGKIFVDIQNSIMNSRDLTLKHMFDITLKLVGEQEEISGLVLLKGCCWNSQKADILLSVQRLHYPGKSQKQRTSIHCCADQKTIETTFRIIAFANQLSLFGAVPNVCEEF